MDDHEWVKEHLSEYHTDDVPPCGISEAGCAFWMIIIAIFLLIQFVLPHFGIKIDLIEMIRNFFQR